MEELLIALAPGLAKLLEASLGETYDREKELEALIQMQRAAADLRVRKALADRK